MIKNEFFKRLVEAENRGASGEELLEIIGRGRSRQGIFEGDLTEGELEIGQACSLVKEIEPVEKVIQTLIAEYKAAIERLYRNK